MDADNGVEASAEDTLPSTADAEPAQDAETGETESADAEIPTITAVPVDDVEGRFVSGKAIIRKGDNLWTIARRVYGRGIKYTTIYEANANEINNPHLIYPGQVFDLPIDQDINK
nr:LysM peptidoglycan-binding domain-containing protein [Maritalea mediterranea]